jgi:hypothetical protein
MKYTDFLQKVIKEKKGNKNLRKEIFHDIENGDINPNSFTKKQATEIYESAGVKVLEKLFANGLDINLNKNQVLKNALRYEKSTYSNYLKIAQKSGQEVIFPKNLDYSLAGEIKYLEIKKVKQLFSLNNYPIQPDDLYGYVGCIGDRYKELPRTRSFQLFFDKICPDECFVNYFISEIGWHYSSLQESITKELYKRRNNIDLKNISSQQKEELKQKLFKEYNQISLSLLYKFINQKIYTKDEFIEFVKEHRNNPSVLSNEDLKLIKDKKLNIFEDFDNIEIDYNGFINLCKNGTLKLLDDNKWQELYSYFENTKLNEDEYKQLIDKFLGNSRDGVYHYEKSWGRQTYTNNNSIKANIEKLHEIILTQYLDTKPKEFTIDEKISNIEKLTYNIRYHKNEISQDEIEKIEETYKNISSLIVKTVDISPSTMQKGYFPMIYSLDEIVHPFYKDIKSFHKLGSQSVNGIKNCFFGESDDSTYLSQANLIRTDSRFSKLKQQIIEENKTIEELKNMTISSKGDIKLFLNKLENKINKYGISYSQFHYIFDKVDDKLFVDFFKDDIFIRIAKYILSQDNDILTKIAFKAFL